MSRLPVTLGVAATVVVVDQLAKVLAVEHLAGRVPVELLGPWLKLNLVRNPGAAFSLGGNYTVLISLLAIGVAVAIVRTSRTLASNWWAVVLGGVLGGAMGNLLDRLLRQPGPFRGHVVDFLQLPNWPVFNVADMALVGSAILAVLLTLFGVEMTAPEAGGRQAPDPSTRQAPALPPATHDQDMPAPPEQGRVAPGQDPADG